MASLDLANCPIIIRNGMQQCPPAKSLSRENFTVAQVLTSVTVKFNAVDG